MAKNLVPSRSRRFTINSIASVLTTLISITVLVWVTKFLLHHISPEEYALIPIVTSLLLTGQILRTLFTGGLARFLVEADAKGDTQEVGRIASSMLLVLVPLAMVMAIAGGAAAWNVERLIEVEPAFADQARMMFALLLLPLCLETALTPLSSGLYVRMQFVKLNLIQLGSEVVRVVILLVLLFGIGPSALWVTVSSAAGALVALAIQVLYTRRLLPEARFVPGLARFATVRLLMTFSLWTTFQGFSTFVQRSLPILVLNQHASAVAVAAFHLGNLADTQIRRITASAVKPAQPELTSIFATRSLNALLSYYFRGGRYLMWIALGMALPLMIFAHPLVELFAGPMYRDAAWVMILILGAYPFAWASGMFYQTAFASGRIGAFNICSIVLSVAILAGLLGFVVYGGMGAIGAGLASASAFALVHLFMIWPLGLRFIGGSARTFVQRTLLPGLMPAACAGTVGLVWLRVVDPDTWLLLGAGTLVVWLVYLLAIRIVALPEDRELQAKAFKRIRGKQLT